MGADSRRDRECNGKNRYPTETIAERYAEIARKKGTPGLHVYRCGTHWHIGHSLVARYERIDQLLRDARNGILPDDEVVGEDRP